MTASDNLPKVSTSGVVSRRFLTTELEPAAEAQGLVASAKFVVERSSVAVFTIPRSVLASTMAMVVFLCVVFSQAPDSSIVPAPVRVLAPAPVQVFAPQRDAVVILGVAPDTCPCSGVDSSLCAHPDLSR